MLDMKQKLVAAAAEGEKITVSEWLSNIKEEDEVETIRLLLDLARKEDNEKIVPFILNGIQNKDKKLILASL